MQREMARLVGQFRSWLALKLAVRFPHIQPVERVRQTVAHEAVKLPRHLRDTTEQCPRRSHKTCLSFSAALASLLRLRLVLVLLGKRLRCFEGFPNRLALTAPFGVPARKDSIGLARALVRGRDLRRDRLATPAARRHARFARASRRSPLASARR